MTELNADGLMPGQEVDFETLQRIERARPQRQKVEQASEEQGQQEATPVRRGRPPKVANNG